MIGIYKYTNKINGKSYIGLSNDIQRRQWEHQTLANQQDTSHFHRALCKYGMENFVFEVLETFETEDRELLGKREQYWIQYYNTYAEGYNETLGGDITQGKPKLTKQDVIDIRTRYANLERCMIVYEDYKDRIGRSGVNKIWKGETWKSIMPEVYTEERKLYHRMPTGNSGTYNGRAILTESQVLEIRTRYKNGESFEEIYKDYPNTLTPGSFKRLLQGHTWKNIKP